MKVNQYINDGQYSFWDFPYVSNGYDHFMSTKMSSADVESEKGSAFDLYFNVFDPMWFQLYMKGRHKASYNVLEFDESRTSIIASVP